MCIMEFESNSLEYVSVIPRKATLWNVLRSFLLIVLGVNRVRRRRGRAIKSRGVRVINAQQSFQAATSRKQSESSQNHHTSGHKGIYAISGLPTQVKSSRNFTTNVINLSSPCILVSTLQSLRRYLNNLIILVFQRKYLRHIKTLEA